MRFLSNDLCAVRQRAGLPAGWWRLPTTPNRLPEGYRARLTHISVTAVRTQRERRCVDAIGHLLTSAPHSERCAKLAVSRSVLRTRCDGVEMPVYRCAVLGNFDMMTLLRLNVVRPREKAFGFSANSALRRISRACSSKGRCLSAMPRT